MSEFFHFLVYRLLRDLPASHRDVDNLQAGVVQLVRHPGAVAGPHHGDFLQLVFKERKSVPRVGFDTAARMNVHRNVRIPKERERVTLPQDRMVLPSAPARMGPVGVEDCLCSSTLKAAPVSTKNFYLLFSS